MIKGNVEDTMIVSKAVIEQFALNIKKSAFQFIGKGKDQK